MARKYTEPCVACAYLHRALSVDIYTVLHDVASKCRAMWGIYLDVAMQWVTLASSYGDLAFSMLYKASLTCTVKCRIVSMQHMLVQFGSTPTVRLGTCSQLTVQHSVVDKGEISMSFSFC